MKQDGIPAKKKSVIVLITILCVVSLGGVYLLGVRPQQIKAHCHKGAIYDATYNAYDEQGRVIYSEQDPLTNGYSKAKYEQLYTLCTRSSGVQ